MSPRRRSLWRLAATVLVLVGIEWGAALLLAQLHLMEHVLAPGDDSLAALAVAGVFLVYRVFVVICLPGWVAVRLLRLAWDRQVENSRGVR